MRKNKLKIFALLAFILIGVFWGVGRVAKVQAENLVECKRKASVAATASYWTKGDVKCDLDQNQICAYYSEWGSLGWYPKEICKKLVEARHCLGEDPDCNTDFEGALFGGDVENVKMREGIETVPAYYMSDKDYKIGCQQGFSPASTGDHERAIGVGLGRRSAEIYQCLEETDPGVYQDACGDGRGVHKEGDQIIPTACVSSDKQCVPQTKDGQYVFFAIANRTLTREQEWVDVGNPSRVVIKPGSKAYCYDTYQEIDSANCYLEADKDLIDKDSPGRKITPSINAVYGAIVGQNVKEYFRPHYECEEGGSAFWQIFNSTIGVALTTIFGLIASVIIFILGAVFWLVTAFLEWVMGISKIEVGIIDIVWEFLRDFSNMFFIIILLYIAFCTVLRIQSQNIKKALPWFMFSVILINFSQVICQIVLDFSQILIDGIYYLMPGNWWGRVNFVLHAGGMDEWMNVRTVFGSRKLNDFVGVIGAQGLSILYMVASVIVFGATAFLLAIRIVVLWIMTAISPLIYVAMAVGNKGIVKKYWISFLRTAFFAPVMIFCIVISIVILSYDLDDYLKSEVGTVEQVLSEEATQGNIVTEAGSFQNFIQLIFALAFMCTGLVVARKGSVIGADGVVKGAMKLGKMTAPWITGVKPAGHGVKALAGYGWRQALKSRAGKYLKVVSPTVWKRATKARRERVMEETFVPRAAELQPRLAGWHAFWHGGGPAYEMEKKRADSAKRKLAKDEGDRLTQTDEPSESFIGVMKVALDQAKERGDLGSIRALTPLVEGALRTAGIARGDWNDVLKSKFLKESGYGIQRATTGADVRMFKQLFGDDPEAIQVLNSLAESSKSKYTHLAYATYFDEEQGKLIYGIDRKATRSEMKSELEKLNKRRLKAGEQEMEFDDFYEEIIENLGQVDSTVRENKRLQQLGMADEVANIIKFYNNDRSKTILGELAKKSPKDKWTVNPGAFAAEIGGGYTDPETGEWHKYYGETASTEAYVESATMADATRIDSWAPPRMRKAILGNEKMVNKVLEGIETKRRKEKKDELEQAKAVGNREEVERIENYITEQRVVWNALYRKLKIKEKTVVDGTKKQTVVDGTEDETTRTEEDEADAAEDAAAAAEEETEGT